jgi:hypothetical protein
LYTKRLVAPAANGHDNQTTPQQQLQGLELVLVSHATDALGAALAKHRVKGYVAPR